MAFNEFPTRNYRIILTLRCIFRRGFQYLSREKYLRSQERDQVSRWQYYWRKEPAIKRANESRLVLRPNSKVRGQNKAPPCRPRRAGRAEIGPRLTFQSRRASARAQESSWSIAIGRRGAVVSPARWRCRQFFYYESGHERRRARTRART